MTKLEFAFAITDSPDGQSMPVEEVEAKLLTQLEERGGACADTLWQLARLCSLTGRQRQGLEFIERIVATTDDRETLASGCLAEGQLMEQLRDFAGAVPFYESGLALQPTSAPVRYLLHNNLGFSLNQLGKYPEGEVHCRAAIEVDATRPNAFKNLGLSLQGQGRYALAARSFVDATKANASDPRSAKHLRDLLTEHGADVEAEVPDIREQLQACDAAVAAAQIIQKMR